MANDKRLPNSNKAQEQKSKFDVHILKRPKKCFFDSADWSMEGKSYVTHPPKAIPGTVNKNPENKENFNTEENKHIVTQIIKHQLADKPERVYFDSADWQMEIKKETVPGQTYKMFPQKGAGEIATKKRIEKSRKYFDSADWALAVAGVTHESPAQAQAYPKILNR